MPAIRNLEARMDRLMMGRISRMSRVEDVVLPKDFCITVSDKCEEEGAKVRATRAHFAAELGKVEAELTAATARTPYSNEEVRSLAGDPLDLQSTRVVSRPVHRRTADTIEYEKEVVRPLRERAKKLRAMVYLCDTEIAELKRINRMAYSGDMGLIHHLSDKWRSRLEIGSAMLGDLPKVAQALAAERTLYVDAAGQPLPPEAIDKETSKPDLPFPMGGGPAPEPR